MQEKKFFCYEIYKNLSVWSRNGQIEYGPCSIYSGHIKKSDRLVLDETWNQPEHQLLKQSIENNVELTGCKHCFNSEQNGIESRRCGSKKLYEEFHKDVELNIDSPQGLDYSVGNLCNLKCMICGPQNSTSWIPDYQKIYPDRDISNLSYKKFEQLTITDSSFLKNLKNVHFHGGGEPLLSRAHVELLLKIKEVKGLQDVRVFYNTNATVTPSDEVLKLWEECQLIELYFSIDDIESRFEYQRTGANWLAVTKNLDWFYHHMPHNHMFNVNCVWSYLNLFYLDELVDWYSRNFSQNLYGDPTNLIFQRAIGEFNITAMHEKLHQMLQDKFVNHLELLSLVNAVAVDNSTEHQLFWNYINKIDSVRKQSFKQVCPEWSQLL
jgi:pyruvate-formate lyase-activating enzyme